MEALRLRVQDLDFAAHQLLIRGGKGNKDRVTSFPQNLMDPLQIHLQEVRRLHRQDLAAGWGQLPLPNALARKYTSASREWVWQWVFPQVIAGVRRSWQKMASLKLLLLDQSLVLSPGILVLPAEMLA